MRVHVFFALTALAALWCAAGFGLGLRAGLRPRARALLARRDAPLSEAELAELAAAQEEEDAELERLVDNLPSKRMRSAPSGKKARKARVKVVPLRPEFSRIINVGAVPEKRPVLCKLLAKPAEREGLALRFDLPELSHFAANVTVRRQDPYTILVEGTIEAHITAATQLLPPQEIFGSFETLVLDTVSSGAAKESMSFEEATDYDEEIAPNGDIDIGEIAAQYFALEVFS